MDDVVKKRLNNLNQELASLPPDALDFLRDRISRHSFVAHLDAHRSTRFTFELGSFCSKTDLLVLSGRDLTDHSGKAVLPIHRLLCGAINLLPNVQLVLIREPQFVATPLSSVPVFATAMTRSTQRQGNVHGQPILETVEVEVMMWKPDGTAAAETSFSWVCTIEAGRIYLEG